MKEITNNVKIGDQFLITYNEFINFNRVKNMNLDLVLKDYSDVEIGSLPCSSVVISAAVTAYARIAM